MRGIEPLFPPPDRARSMSCGAIRACARCSMTSRGIRRRDARLRARSRTASCRCCRCSAARSPPTEDLRRKRSNRLAARLRRRAPPWTVHARLPGGDLPAGGFAAFSAPWGIATRGCRRRCANGTRAYGTRIERLLGAPDAGDLGEEVLPGLLRARDRISVAHRVGANAADILWRRTKLGLHLLNVDSSPLERWLAAHCGDAGARREAPTPGCDRASRFSADVGAVPATARRAVLA